LAVLADGLAHGLIGQDRIALAAQAALDAPAHPRHRPVNDPGFRIAFQRPRHLLEVPVYEPFLLLCQTHAAFPNVGTSIRIAAGRVQRRGG